MSDISNGCRRLVRKDGRVQVVDELQRVIEDLAQRLRRSVAVDDPALRLVACSSHFGDVDQARLDSLVGRRVEGAMRDHVMATGITQWRRPGRIVARPDLGTERDRVGFPLRSRFELLGFMWVLDDGTITPEQMQEAEQTAQRVQEILGRRLMSQKDDETEQESALLGLLSPTEEDRDAAARQLHDRGRFPRVTGFSALALRSSSSGAAAAGVDDRHRPVDEPDVDLVRHACAMAALCRPPGSVAYAVTGPETLVVAAGGASQDLRALAVGLHRELLAADPQLASRTTIGVGSRRPRLADIGLSFDQAMIAARVAARLGRPTGMWGEDAPDLLLEVVLRPAWDDGLVPGVLTTLDETQPEVTLRTVRAYLDHAGNVPVTAEALHAHRSTVYYHLQKFQTSTGLDLDDGDTRLMVQLWLRIGSGRGGS